MLAKSIISRSTSTKLVSRVQWKAIPNTRLSFSTYKLPTSLCTKSVTAFLPKYTFQTRNFVTSNNNEQNPPQGTATDPNHPIIVELDESNPPL